MSCTWCLQDRGQGNVDARRKPCRGCVGALGTADRPAGVRSAPGCWAWCREAHPEAGTPQTRREHLKSARVTSSSLSGQNGASFQERACGFYVARPHSQARSGLSWQRPWEDAPSILLRVPAGRSDPGCCACVHPPNHSVPGRDGSCHIHDPRTFPATLTAHAQPFLSWWGAHLPSRCPSLHPPGCTVFPRDHLSWVRSSLSPRPGIF